MSIPPDYKPHFRTSPLTDPWEPLYSKRTETGIVIGLIAGEQHCNSRGFVHGGLISAVADNAMGLSCATYHQDTAGLVTINLHVDFVGKAMQGDWLEFDTHYVKPGRSVDIAQGRVLANGTPCALIGATFKVLTK